MIRKALSEKKLITELREQSNNHPDSSLREFYSFFLEELESNKELKKTMDTIAQARKDITTKHLANLIYRAFQYIMVFEYGNLELGKNKKEDWKKDFSEVLNNEKNLNTYIDLLRNENTQTTIYQRYLGPKAVIAQIYGNKEVNVLDIGCGLNMGLPGLEKNIEFNSFEDFTDNKVIDTLVNSNIKIKQGYAVDLFYPHEKKNWALACGFYPQELKNLPNVEAMCEKIWQKTKVKFYTKSIFEVSKLWKEKKLPKLDVVITSTILYQFEEKDINKALKEVAKIIEEGGVLIINDFVAVNGSLVWKGSWFGSKKFGYKTVILVKTKKGFSKPLEFIKWDNGRCKKAFPGRDFEKVLKITKS